MASTVLVLILIPVLYLIYGLIAMRNVPLEAPPPAERELLKQDDPFAEEEESPMPAEVMTSR
jgi:hypothetical protein